MKTLMLAAIAAAISVSALPAMSVPSKAASVVITTDNDNMRHDDRYWRHHHRDRDRDHWRDRDRGHDRKCRVKIEKRWHNGHPVIREVKICRGDDF
jgi:Ni/Co efflux regulator RcnB